MKIKTILSLFLFLFFTSAVKLKGISSEDLVQLKFDSKEFTCRDESKVIPFVYVNDDYCDCQDGSDEPGTSACPNSFFYCENKLHFPKKIFSSAVSDGICDCCDGTDELENYCPNKCKELAEITLKEQRQYFMRYTQGVKTKGKMISEGQSGLIEKQSEVEIKQTELGELKKDVDSLNIIVEELKIKLEQKRSSLKEIEKIQSNQDEKKQDSQETEELEQETELELENNKEEQELEEQELEEQEEQELEEQKLLKEENDKSEEKLEQEIPKEPEDEEFKSIKEDLKNSETKLNEAKNKVNALERQIKDLNQLLAIDFGENKEFFPLYGKCLEIQSEYTYELCPFEKVTQKQKSGGNTPLGTWQNEQSNDWSKEHKIMRYTGGQRCWGGPERSTTVEVLCGPENTIEEPKEPNKCEYTLKLFTPAACNEQLADELWSQLQERVHKHDEL